MAGGVYRDNKLETSKPIPIESEQHIFQLLGIYMHKDPCCCC